MSAGYSPPRQSATYRAIAGCGGTLAAVVVIGVFWAMASVPRPPPPGTTDERQAGYRMERDAGDYARALFDASRDAPLTEARLAAVPVPHEGASGSPGSPGRVTPQSSPSPRTPATAAPTTSRRRWPATGSNWSGSSATPG